MHADGWSRHPTLGHNSAAPPAVHYTMTDYGLVPQDDPEPYVGVTTLHQPKPSLQQGEKANSRLKQLNRGSMPVCFDLDSLLQSTPEPHV